MNKPKPILFSAPMVRANIREVQHPGTGKTQTRHLAKWQHVEPGINLGFSGLSATRLRTNDTPDGVWTLTSRGRGGCWNERARLRTFAVGDVLWVRETWMVCGDGVWTIADARMRMAPHQRTIYAADATGADASGPWWPSIHMPREFSRLTLEVIGVKVERLQDISEEDCLAEGIYGHHSEELGCTLYSYDTPGHVGFGCRTSITVRPAGWSAPRHAFLNLWDKVNGAGAWDANPWVVAVTYRPHLMNVDAFLAQRSTA